MKTNILNKQGLFFIILITLISFLILPQNLLAEEKIQISETDRTIFLNLIQGHLDSEWKNLNSSASFLNPNKEIVILITRNALRPEIFHFWLNYLSKGILKAGFNIIRYFYFTPDLEEIFNKIQSKTLDEAEKILKNWLYQKEIRISSGEINYSYESYKGEKQETKFQYVLVYYPLDVNGGEIAVEFYSEKPMEPPMANFYTPWDFSTWIQQGNEYLDPFILRVKMGVRKEGMGYIWDKSKPSVVEVTFSEPVPHIEIPSWKEKAWNKVTKFVKDVGGIGGRFFALLLEKINPFGAELVKGPLPSEESSEPKPSESLKPSSQEKIETEEIEKEITYQPIAQVEQSPSPPIYHYYSPEKEIGTKVPAQEEPKETKEQVSDSGSKSEDEPEEEPEDKGDKFVYSSGSGGNAGSSGNGSGYSSGMGGSSESNGDSGDNEQDQVANQSFPGLENLLISEVAAGWDKSQNEFIEIFNPNDFEVQINEENFKLILVNSSNNTTTKQLHFSQNTILANSYFLLVGGEIFSITTINTTDTTSTITTTTELILPDATYSPQLSSVSGVIITDQENNIIDRVSWGKSQGSPDENHQPPEAATEETGITLENGLKTGKSLERKSTVSSTAESLAYGGDEFGQNGYDNNDNSQDFVFQPKPNPQNSIGQVGFLEEYFEESEDESEEEEEQQEEEEPPFRRTPNNFRTFNYHSNFPR